MELRSVLQRFAAMHQQSNPHQRRPPVVGLALIARLAPVVGLALIIALLAGACTAGSSAPSTGASSTPGPSAAASAASSNAAGGSTAESAFAAVRARSPWFDSIKHRDANTVGQGAWWDATASAGGTWLVTVEIGWGDCQAGCIDRHTWRWLVGPGSSIVLQSQSGAPVPDDQRQALAATASGSGIGGEVTAGPTCPVQRPGDAACAERPVEGAVLSVQDAGGKEVATFTTDASGLFRIALPAGAYTVVPRPVAGLMGTGRPQPVTVVDGKLALVPIGYDTGIR